LAAGWQLLRFGNEADQTGWRWYWDLDADEIIPLVCLDLINAGRFSPGKCPLQQICIAELPGCTMYLLFNVKCACIRFDILNAITARIPNGCLSIKKINPWFIIPKTADREESKFLIDLFAGIILTLI
jgi:hypothetical protein